MTPGGEVGSIGVYMAHVDVSGAMEKDGVKVTLVSAGENKVEGNPYQPLAPDAKKFMQSRINDYYGAFTRDVAKGRGVSVDTVRNDMGKGRCYGAAQAKAAGMVDGVMTFPTLVSHMFKGSSPKKALAQVERERYMRQLERECEMDRLTYG